MKTDAILVCMLTTPPVASYLSLAKRLQTHIIVIILYFAWYGWKEGPKRRSNQTVYCFIKAKIEG